MSKTLSLTNALPWAASQGRHLFHQMCSGTIKDQEFAARGLLGPVIERLEEMDRQLNELRELAKTDPAAAGQAIAKME